MKPADRMLAHVYRNVSAVRSDSKPGWVPRDMDHASPVIDTVRARVGSPPSFGDRQGDRYLPLPPQNHPERRSIRIPFVSFNSVPDHLFINS